jgi:hypothetical protein
MQFTGLNITTLLPLIGLAALAVTALYLLKLRKRRVEVPFSAIWTRVLLEHQEHNDLFKRLRRILSWFLQITLLILLGFALSDPHVEEEMIQGRHIVLLIDTSASMAATDVSGAADRLGIAKNKALEILATLGPDDRAMLVHFDRHVRPLSPFVADAAILEKPVRDLQTAATPTSFKDAIAFAVDSLRNKQRTELVLISDGAGFDPQTLEDLDVGTITLRHLKIGESHGNLAVTGFNARRYRANKLDFELFVQVRSYFDREISADLQLFADGRLVDSKPITMGPRDIYQEFYPSQAISGEKLEARIVVKSDDARDVFPLDNRAFAMLPATRRTRVLLVTEGNLYLEGPLLLNPNLEVTRISPSQYESAVDFDVVFFDRFAPASPPLGNAVFIDPQGDPSPWASKGDIQDPIVTEISRGHPLLRWLTLKDLNIGSARKLKRSKDDRVVVGSALGHPLILTRTTSERRYVAFAFDIRASDLPLRVAFPVLIVNLIDYLQGDESGLVRSYVTGEPWSIPLATSGSTATLHTPSGVISSVPVFAGEAFVYGAEPGFYKVQAEEEILEFAANLSSAAESDVRPAPITLSEKEIRHDTNELLFDRSEIWIWLVLLVLAMLHAEWWTYNRRITI